MKIWILHAFFVLCAVTALQASQNSRYISFATIPFRGHYNQIRYLAAELNKRGNRVSFVLPDGYEKWVQEVNDEQKTNIEYIPVGQCPPDSAYSYASEDFGIQGFNSFLDLITDYEVCMFDGTYRAWKSDRPDLVIGDIVTVAAFDAADGLGLTVMKHSPVFTSGVYEVPMWYPRIASVSGIEMSFGERIVNFFITVSGRITTWIIVNRVNEFRAKYAIKPWSSIGFWGNDVVTTLNAAFGFEYAYPRCPNFQHIGPMGIPETLDPLPTDLDRWLNSSENVIYASMGTYVAPTSDFLGKLANGLKNSGYKVLWSLRKEQQKYLPKLAEMQNENFRVETFVPQLAVLNHPNVKVFLSHCGSSCLESLYYGVPLVCIPYAIDQPDNCVRVRDAGTGLCINKNSFTAEEVSTKLKTVMTEQSYLNNAGLVSRIFKEAGGLKKGADIAESIIENGYKHLICKSATIDTILFYNLDIYAFLIVSTSIELLLVWKLLQCLLCRRSTTAKLPSGGSKKKRN